MADKRRRPNDDDDLAFVLCGFSPPISGRARIGRRRAMATPDPPPGSGTVTVASQGAAAFVGDVYYLADGRTGDPILGWPPRPPPVGFSRGEKRDADDGPDAFGRTKAQREGDRVLLATNSEDATKALRRFREQCFPSPRGSERDENDDASSDAVASLAVAAFRNRALGPSAYFPDRAFAVKWAEVVNRPCGLSYVKHGRRRLRRPSDKPLLPNGIAIQPVPFARAYGNLCVGWNNAALAAKRGVAASLSARRDATDVLFSSSNLDPEKVMGANPEIAGDGNAETLAPLLTGYDDFLPFKPFEKDLHEKETSLEKSPPFKEGTRSLREARPRVNAWLVEDLSTVSLETLQTASENSFDDASGTPYPSSGSWRAVAARVEDRDARTKRKNASSNNSRDEPRSSSSRFFGDDVDLKVTDSKRRDENANENDGVANTASSDVEAVAFGGRTPWWAKTFFDDAFSFSGKFTPHEALDRLVAARAVDRESVSVGECPRRVPGPRHRPPADTPVFSSPLVHVVAPGGVSNVSSSTPDAKTVSRETTEPAPSPSPSPRGDDDATTGTSTRGGTVSVSDARFGTNDEDGSSPTYPLGVKLAMSDETTGAVTVTSAQMYRPWFFNVEDLRAMVRAAIKAEAEARVARNKARREKTNRALAAMLTAVCHTKPNPRLSGFQMPGLDGSNRGGAGKGSGGGGVGGVYGGGGDDDDEPEDDDDDPRNEGLEDDDDGSLNDDELMKEYMREMVKDGTAEDALGSWARDAARAAKEARENELRKGRGKSGDGRDDANETGSPRWLPSFLRPRTETEKETYQQLDVSPFAHAGLVFAVTAYYAWNVTRSVCGDALDRAFLSTNFGRWALVIDTPLADAADQIEVGSFEGVCCAAVAEAAADDIRRRYEANAKARSKLTARLRTDVAAASEAKRRAVENENAIAAAAEQHLDALDALGNDLRGRRGRGGDDTNEVFSERQTETNAASEEVSDRRDGVDASASTPSRQAQRRGGFLRAIPLLRRIPVLGAKKNGFLSDGLRRTALDAKSGGRQNSRRAARRRKRLSRRRGKRNTRPTRTLRSGSRTRRRRKRFESGSNRRPRARRREIRREKSRERRRARRLVRGARTHTTVPPFGARRAPRAFRCRLRGGEGQRRRAALHRGDARRA
jgi:hypothetical protein